MLPHILPKETYSPKSSTAVGYMGQNICIMLSHRLCHVPQAGTPEDKGEPDGQQLDVKGKNAGTKGNQKENVKEQEKEMLEGRKGKSRKVALPATAKEAPRRSTRSSKSAKESGEDNAEV